MRKRKIPLRKCIGCGENKPKGQLIRIVRNKEGQIKLDVTGKANGRGAYVCNDLQCLEKVRKNKSLNKTFRTDVSKQVYDSLVNEIKKEKE